MKRLKRVKISRRFLSFMTFLGFLFLLKDATTNVAIGLSLFYFSGVLKECL